MTLQLLTDTDFGDAGVQKVNAAIGAVNAIPTTIAQEAAFRTQGDAGLTTALTQETESRSSADAAILGALSQENSERVAEVSAVANSITQEAANRQAAISAEAARIDAIAMAILDRPGDNPSRFTSLLGGSGAASSPLAINACVAAQDGTAYRVTGSLIVAPRAPTWIEPNRSYAVRFAYRRFATPTDPAGDAIRCGMAWLDQSYNLLATTAVSDADLVTPSSGLCVVMATVGRRVVPIWGISNGIPLALTPPAGAVYMRPFVQTYGSDGVTDVGMVATVDITDTTAFSPDLSALQADMTALQTYVHTIDPLAAGTANGLATLDSTGKANQPVSLTALSASAGDMATAMGTPSLKQFGSAPDGDGTWTSTIAAAEASAAKRIYVPAGTYTTAAAFVFKMYYGPGQIRTGGAGGNLRAFEQVVIQSRPTTTGVYTDPTKYFQNGDYSRTISAEEITIVDPASPAVGVMGAASGQGYSYTPEVSGHFTSAYYASGYNSKTDNQDGDRTGWNVYDVRIEHEGQGDVSAYFAAIHVSSVRPGATHWLASPAGSIFGGIVTIDASAPGAYGQGDEVHIVAAPNTEAAMIGSVRSVQRTSAAITKGATVQSYRAQSVGPVPGDVGYAVAGNWVTGWDTVTATLTNGAAGQMAVGQRIYFDASAVDVAGQPAFWGNVNGSSYITKTGDTVDIVVASAADIAAGTPGNPTLQISNSGLLSDGTLGAAGGFGVNGVAPIAKPTVTGSKSGGAALTSLLAALVSYGLITDSTTA